MDPIRTDRKEAVSRAASETFNSLPSWLLLALALALALLVIALMFLDPVRLRRMRRWFRKKFSRQPSP